MATCVSHSRSQFNICISDFPSAFRNVASSLAPKKGKHTQKRELSSEPTDTDMALNKDSACLCRMILLVLAAGCSFCLLLSILQWTGDFDYGDLRECKCEEDNDCGNRCRDPDGPGQRRLLGSVNDAYSRSPDTPCEDGSMPTCTTLDGNVWAIIVVSLVAFCFLCAVGCLCSPRDTCKDGLPCDTPCGHLACCCCCSLCQDACKFGGTNWCCCFRCGRKKWVTGDFDEQAFSRANAAHDKSVAAATQRRHSAGPSQSRQIQFTLEIANNRKLTVSAFSNSTVTQLGEAVTKLEHPQDWTGYEHPDITLSNQPLDLLNGDGTKAELGAQGVLEGTQLQALTSQGTATDQVSDGVRQSESEAE